MPLKQHPTDPDKLVFVKGEYNLQKPWVGLTDEEVQYIADSEYEEAFVRLVEAKLKEKNT